MAKRHENESHPYQQDPTENVKNLTEASTKRLDDLRDAEIRHTREVNELRTGYEALLREAEAKRIDAIRAVDIAAVQRAAEVSATQASTLASQVLASAETLRNQVAATTTAGQVALAAALDPIIKDIADLRRVQYEQVGQKAQVTESRGINASVMTAIGLGCTLIFLILGILGFILGRVG